MPDAPLLSYLATRDTPCPVCLYNLRGLRSDNCPECAARLELAVASPNLRLGPFVLLIVSFSLAAGFDLVVSLMVTLMTWRLANPAVAATWIGPVLVAITLAVVGTLCLVPIALLVHRRSRWNLLAPRPQWRIAIATFAAVGFMHAVLGAVLFSIAR